MPGEIPQSSALSEASEGDSLAEVMSRDPEGLSRQDRDRVIEALRAQRARIAAAELAGPKPKQPKAAGFGKPQLSEKSDKDLDELGL